MVNLKKTKTLFRPSYLRVWATLALLGIFAFDLATPLGLVVYFQYVAVVLAAVWLSKGRGFVKIALASSILIVAGYFYPLDSVGVPVWVRISNRAFAMAATWIVVALGIKIKQAEQNLQHAHDDLEERVHDRTQQLKTLLDSIVEGVVSVDRSLVVQYVNPFALSLMEIIEQSAVGHRIEGVLPLTDSTRQESFDLRSLVLESISQRELRSIEGVWLKTKEGSLVPLDITVAPEYGRLRESAGAVIIFRDVSDKLAADELRESILSLATHELLTPLQHIKGYSSGLLQTDVDWDEETRLDFIRTIDREADRLKKLIDDILDLSRLQSGRFPLELEIVPAAEVVETGLGRAKPYLINHKVSICLDERAGSIHADIARLEQVLANLLQNAAKYSPEGSAITIETAQDAGNVVFSVRDEGIGIPPEYHEKIFEKFVRIQNASTRGASGIGLGLALCKAVVEAHDGRIWVESEPGKGSVFRFAIPARRPSKSLSQTA
ncbi:MAG: ATP-binding protein [Chloroflexi bacterium]|nr:ATP-binding protein [Chloroflexota bacterium]